jgi:hypothetical protein
MRDAVAWRGECESTRRDKQSHSLHRIVSPFSLIHFVSPTLPYSGSKIVVSSVLYYSRRIGSELVLYWFCMSCGESGFELVLGWLMENC